MSSKGIFDKIVNPLSLSQPRNFTTLDPKYSISLSKKTKDLSVINIVTPQVLNYIDDRTKEPWETVLIKKDSHAETRSS